MDGFTVNSNITLQELDKKRAEFKKNQLAAKLPKVKKFNYQSEKDLPQINWVSHKFGLRRGGTYLVTGYSNAGKTFFASYLGLCIQNDLPVLNQTLDETGKVLYLDWDLGEDTGLYQYKVRNGLKEEYSDIGPIEDFDYIDMRSQFRLDDMNPEIENMLVEMCKNYIVIIIDSLIPSLSNPEINDDRCRLNIDLLNRVADKTNTCIVILHHEAKATQQDTLKRGKGSSSIIAAVRGSLSLERKPSGEIQIITGKKRLTTGCEFYYTLDDCGEYSETLRSPCGIKLTVVDGSQFQEESNDARLIRLLKLIQQSPGINLRAIYHQMTGAKEANKKILEWALDNQLVVVEKAGQIHRHTLTSEGMSRLQYEVKNEG